MVTTQLEKLEVFHRNYNLDKKHNLEEIPEGKAVFGIFAIVNEEPLNCRYIAATDNLRQTVQELFENPPGEGLKKFMQGAWIQMLVYEPLAADTPAAETNALLESWREKHRPNIDNEGEYPGYYEY